jgi:hypothetical protein
MFNFMQLILCSGVGSWCSEIPFGRVGDIKNLAIFTVGGNALVIGLWGEEQALCYN